MAQRRERTLVAKTKNSLDLLLSSLMKEEAHDTSAGVRRGGERELKNPPGNECPALPGTATTSTSIRFVDKKQTDTFAREGV